MATRRNVPKTIRLFSAVLLIVAVPVFCLGLVLWVVVPRDRQPSTSLSENLPLHTPIGRPLIGAQTERGAE